MKDFKYEAAGANLFIVRDEVEKEKDGFYIPDQAQKKPNMGEIVSVGSLFKDKRAKVGRKAIFSKQIGQDVDLDGILVTVLREDQVLGYK